MTVHHIKFEKKKFISTLVIAIVFFEILLVLLDIFVNYRELIPADSIQRLFNVAREDSLSAWFSTVQTLAVGFVLVLIYLHQQKKGWGFIAGFFLYLAMDDGAKIHERVGTAVKNSANRGIAEADSWLSFFPSYTWQVVFGPLFVFTGLFILAYIWREVRQNQIRALIFAALSCYGVAVGLDFVEGIKNGGYEAVATHLGLTSSFVNHFGRVLEEFLEMLGSTLFLTAFISYYISISPKTEITFKS